MEVLPGQDGMIHISELADFRVEQVEDVDLQRDAQTELKVDSKTVAIASKTKPARAPTQNKNKKKTKNTREEEQGSKKKRNQQTAPERA